MIGWIKLHRRLLNNAIFYKPDYFQVWIYILLKVNHEDNKFIWNNESKIVKKGCGIFSQKEMSSEFKFPISKINRILLYLQNENQISFTGYSKYTEIQVLRWEEYQDAFENGNQKETKRKAGRKQEESKEKAEGNEKETNKNDKNDKNIYTKHLFQDSIYFDFKKFEEHFISSKYKDFDLEYYYDAVKDWSASGGNKKVDWIATARGFMNRDAKQNKSVKKTIATTQKQLTPEQAKNLFQ